MKKFEIIKSIQKSIIHKCICCGNKNCCQSHSISKKMYLSKISENKHVYGNYRQKGVDNFELISINDASSFYNFCNKCDSMFYEIDTKPFSEENKKQLFLIYFRLMSAQVHQLSEEYKVMSKFEFQNKDSYLLALSETIKKYKKRIKSLYKNLLDNSFNINYKIFKIQKQIDFIYANVVNVVYDVKLKFIQNNNEIAIKIFSQDNISYIVFIWETQNDKLNEFINQLNSFSEKKLLFYITNIIMAFPMNLFITPSKFLKWKYKLIFERIRKFFGKLKIFNHIEYLYMTISQAELLNIFDL